MRSASLHTYYCKCIKLLQRELNASEFLYGYIYRERESEKIMIQLVLLINISAAERK